MNYRFNARTMSVIQRTDLDLFRRLYEDLFSRSFICKSCGLDWNQFRNIRDYLKLPVRGTEK